MEIDLSNRQDVDGRLDERFQELRNLEHLDLRGTDTSGNIGVLRHNMELRYLNFNNTRVSGYLEDLRNFTELWYVNLANTAVRGNIAAFENSKELRFLNLHSTKVFGYIAALQDTTQLKDFENFDVSNTKITCPQEGPLRAVLLKLGFTESQLKDLHEMDGLQLRWTLSCCKFFFFHLY